MQERTYMLPDLFCLIVVNSEDVTVCWVQGMIFFAQAHYMLFVHRRDNLLNSLSDVSPHWYSKDQLLWDLAGKRLSGVLIKDFFFCQGFLLRTLTSHRRAGEGRGPFFIPLYHFHPLTNIQTFICNFACEITMTYF